jgi:hypothetical protein
MAAVAAQSAVVVLKEHPSLSPIEALGVCQRALLGTRGAAISIISLASDGTKLTYAGIGNVDGQVWQGDIGRRLAPDRGIVGAAHRTIHTIVLPLTPPWIVLLHSDGISARFDAPSVPDEIKQDPGTLAEFVLAHWGRDHDDATIVVACSSGQLIDGQY